MAIPFLALTFSLHCIPTRENWQEDIHMGFALVLVRSAVAVLIATTIEAAEAAGDPVRGAHAFQACAACHSVEPGEHMTGPSLAHVWGRKAGTVEGFPRFSDALKRSGVVWNEAAFDAWLRNPAGFVPGNRMTFQGLPDGQTRSDLIAYLRRMSEGKAAAPSGATPALPDLKAADPTRRVAAMRYCGDTYYVTTASGQKFAFWEFNLRLKTDSTKHGPARGEPILVGAGMMGDRAQVVFANPGEISNFIKNQC